MSAIRFPWLPVFVVALAWAAICATAAWLLPGPWRQVSIPAGGLLGIPIGMFAANRAMERQERRR